MGGRGMGGKLENFRFFQIKKGGCHCGKSCGDLKLKEAIYIYKFRKSLIIDKEKNQKEMRFT
jgi:hypothetical protein